MYKRYDYFAFLSNLTSCQWDPCVVTKLLVFVFSPNRERVGRGVERDRERECGYMHFKIKDPYHKILVTCMKFSLNTMLFFLLFFLSFFFR